VFLSAFLLFLVQPMLTKALLPAYGGSYLVWGAAMVFFQAMLLLGYLASHIFQVKFGVIGYSRWHIGLLLVPFLMFPFRLDWAGVSPDANLAAGVFRQLFVVAGVPFLVLSMTSTILQRWLMVSDLQQRHNPYVLYAASNAGSVFALLAYPLLIEPVSTLQQQALGWWAGYAVLVLLHSLVLPRAGNANDAHEIQPDAEVIRAGARIRWFLLSFATGTLLLGTTNVITFDIAAVPLLWVVPLAIFLLTYVLVFKARMWCPPWIPHSLNWSMLVAGGLVLLLRLRVMLPPAGMLLVYLLVLFTGCMNCNLWLVRLRPTSGKGLTEFYVILATGGLCGSVLVSWVLPLVSHSLVEYPLGLLLVLFSIGVAAKERWGDEGRWGYVGWGGASLAVMLVLPSLLPTGYPPNVVFAMVALPWTLYVRYAKESHLAASAGILMILLAGGRLDRFSTGGEVVARLRNYYGIYLSYDYEGIRYLQHGTTQHGRQYLDQAHRKTALGYYHPTTPAGRFVGAGSRDLQDVGMIGLGAGAILAYAQDGQRWTVFELDPDNLHIAETYFGYIAQARQQGARVRFRFGDGRLAVAAHAASSFDVLIVDAFSSGSIPVHLLTLEAFETFMRSLRPDGWLLIHLSNRVLDLVPVVHANAKALGLYPVTLTNEGFVHPDAEHTVWVAITRSAADWQVLRSTPGIGADAVEILALPRPWTDHFSHILQTVRWF
jgi:SAM-dependent methyltransferase